MEKFFNEESQNSKMIVFNLKLGKSILVVNVGTFLGGSQSAPAKISGAIALGSGIIVD